MPGVFDVASICGHNPCASLGNGGSMTLLRTIAIFLSAFSALGIAAGQSQEGRILGTVMDQSGGLVKAARVTIVNVDTGVTRTLETNDAGDYVAPSLPPGPYKVVAEATGFKKVERGGVRLEVAKDVRLDLTMQPGSVSETITVTEQLPLVETTNDTLGGTFANKSINDLPLNGRDFQNLVCCDPASSVPVAADFSPSARMGTVRKTTISSSTGRTTTIRTTAQP